MSQVHVSLSGDLSRWTEARAAADGYDDAADYVRDVMQRERDYQDKLARLRAAVDEGLASPVVETTIEDIIARGRARHGLG